jgi:hypothetical protein
MAAGSTLFVRFSMNHMVCRNDSPCIFVNAAPMGREIRGGLIMALGLTQPLREMSIRNIS